MGCHESISEFGTGEDKSPVVLTEISASVERLYVPVLEYSHWISLLMQPEQAGFCSPHCLFKSAIVPGEPGHWSLV